MRIAAIPWRSPTIKYTARAYQFSVYSYQFVTWVFPVCTNGEGILLRW